MDYKAIKEGFVKKLETEEVIEFYSEAEYFFVLAQFIIYVFEALGGVDKYKKEINYLTNSYIPKSIREIGERNINFLKKLSTKLSMKGIDGSKIYKALLENKDRYINNSLNEQLCSDAFFRGLYNSNLFINFFN